MSRDRRPTRANRRPFWLPASTYYFLTAAITLGVFFLTWAILAEAREENPWIAAGLMASTSMIAGVVLREVILRHRRNVLQIDQRRLDTSVLAMPVPVRREPDQNKLTLERNAFLLEEIKKKSEAAKILGHLSESHREVFALCAQYIEVASRELPNVGVGSPRLAAIKKGRDKAERIHQYHMLKWAELEIKKNISRNEIESPQDRLRGAQRALIATDEALAYYPENLVLMDSRAGIEAFVEGEKLTEMMEQARKAELAGEIEASLDLLSDSRDLIGASRYIAETDERLAAIDDEIARISARLAK